MSGGITMYTTKPPKGMRDFLPNETSIRQYVTSTIRKAYQQCGFTEIETSLIENLPNLTGGDGGENTKMIFKILKRGDKLKNASTEDNLADLGLRFDLTLPLVRYYSNNRNELPTTFKAMQIGHVFRGERPQKGRYRSFMQCDVDIIGESSNIAEIEIIHAVIHALKSIGFPEFILKINDRRLLTAFITQCGFPKETVDNVCISLDKYDKIGSDGVMKELTEKGYEEHICQQLMQKLQSLTLASIDSYSPESYDNINTIIEAVEDDHLEVVFDPTLVRGMSYYTGTIYEVHLKGSTMALAGGGRYDKMIGKLSGNDVPAVGFAIGYERIVDHLSASINVPKSQKIAVLLRKEDSPKIGISLIDQWTKQGYITSMYQMKKKMGKQLSQLEKAGYDGYLVPGDAQPTWFADRQSSLI